MVEKGSVENGNSKNGCNFIAIICQRTTGSNNTASSTTTIDKGVPTVGHISLSLSLYYTILVLCCTVSCFFLSQKIYTAGFVATSSDGGPSCVVGEGDGDDVFAADLPPCI